MQGLCLLTDIQTNKHTNTETDPNTTCPDQSILRERGQIHYLLCAGKLLEKCVGY